MQFYPQLSYTDDIESLASWERYLILIGILLYVQDAIFQDTAGTINIQNTRFKYEENIRVITLG